MLVAWQGLIGVPNSYMTYEENPDDFDGTDWAERMGPSLADQLERYFDEIDREGRYIKDWQFISHTFRVSKGFECENCYVSLATHQYLLHTHHRDHNKGNNEPENLIALCVLCHAEHHPHMQANISEGQRSLISNLRKHPQL